MVPEAIAAHSKALSLVGNSSSLHSHGQHAKRLLEEARERIAAVIGADPPEIVFTSGGTEGVNLAIKGFFWARNRDAARARVVVARGEHHATVEAINRLVRSNGAVADEIALDERGRVRLDSAARIVAHDPRNIALMSFVWANGEVGTVNPVGPLAAIASRDGIPVHVDAVAAFGHLPVRFHDVSENGVSAVTVSAHKIGGPVGIGALVLARGSTIVPLFHGGGHERKVRPGTHDVAGAVAFAVAAESAVARLDEESARLSVLRDRLIRGVLAMPGATLSGPVPESIAERSSPPDASCARLATNAHFTFADCEGDSLLLLLDMAGISVSTGSACQAGVPEPSRVLVAMGRTPHEARGALRFSLGRSSTVGDVDALLAALPGAIDRASRAGYSNRPVAHSAPHREAI